MNKYKLVNNSTPLHKLNFEFNHSKIWMKRDDLIDFAFGGNKVRLYEYIANLILEKSVNKVVTYGSKFSNYLRVTAAVCSYLNIECDLIILDESNNYFDGGGNLDLIRYFPVNLVHCPLDKAHDFIDEYKSKLDSMGEPYLWIPGGGHLPEASFGYVDAAKEIKKQMKYLNVSFDAIFLPCGTGTTQAGLVYEFNNDIDIYGISVARPSDLCKKEILWSIEHMERISKRKKSSYNVNVIHNQNEKYGYLSDDIKDTIKRIANRDGVFLDPIYNARAFCGMLKFLESPACYKYKNVLYLNTGGQPNLFLR